MDDILYDFIMGRAATTDAFTFTKVANTQYSEHFSGYVFSINGDDYLINTTSLVESKYEIFKITKKEPSDK